MSHIIKGLLYGLILIIIYTLILAPMIFLQEDSINSCNYSCMVKNFSVFYLTPLGILFLLINLYLGLKISKLSYFFSDRQDELIKESKNSYTWLWDHKLIKVEDYSPNK